MYVYIISTTIDEQLYTYMPEINTYEDIQINIHTYGRYAVGLYKCI